MNMDGNHAFEADTPEELRGIEAALNDLAEAERAGAPQSLEHTVFTASRQELAEAPVIVAKIGPRRTMQLRLALAAAVAIMGAAGAIWLRPAAPSNATADASKAKTLEDDVNYLLALRSADDGMARVNEKIDTLFLDASSLFDSLSTDSAASLLNDGAS